MAFPSIRSEIASSEASNTTSHTITYPATIVAGDTLLCFIACDGDNTFDWAAAETSRGWVKLYEVSSSDNQTCLSVGWIEASGSESGSFELSSSSSEESVNRIFAVKDAEDPDTTPPSVSGAQSSAGSTTVTFSDIVPTGSLVGDSQILGTGDRTLGNVASTEKQAIQISVGSNFIVKDILLLIRKTGTPTDNFLVKIFTDNGGEPSTTQVGGTGTVTGASLTTSLVHTVVTLASTASLTTSTTYWLELSRSGSLDSSNYYRTTRDIDVAGEVALAFESGSWSGITSDLQFWLLADGAVQDILWFIGVGYDDDDGGMTSSFPTGYDTNKAYDISGTGAGTGSLDTSYRTNTAASESPGDGTAVTNEEWVSAVVGVHPAGGGPTLKTLAVATTATPILLKTVTKTITASTTATSILLKTVKLNALVVVATGVAILLKTVKLTLVTSTTATAICLKKPFKLLAVTTTATPILVKVLSMKRTLAATTTATPILLKKLPKTLAATAVGVATIGTVKKILVVLAATATATPIFLKKVSKTLAVTTTGTVILLKKRFVLLAVVASATAILTNKLLIKRTLAIVASATATLATKATFKKVLAAVATATATLGTKIFKILVVVATGVASLATLFIDGGGGGGPSPVAYIGNIWRKFRDRRLRRTMDIRSGRKR